MATIKTVAVAGVSHSISQHGTTGISTVVLTVLTFLNKASGTIGRPILKRLLESNHFDEVRVLTRADSQNEFPPGAIVKKVDYNSTSSLEDALRGVDGLVSAMAFEVIDMQEKLVDAAVAAGVRRMIPAEYGNDTLNPKLATMPIYQPKIAIRQWCERKSADTEGRFTWTVVMNASFLGPDWTLDFIVDMTHRKCDIKDGGDVLFCAATYEDIATAVLGIFTHPEETANRPVKISSIDTTQNELLMMAQELRPEDKWEITHSNTEDLERIGRERWAKGDRSFEAQGMMINRAFLGKGWGGYFPEKDNELLGIKGLDKQSLKDIIRRALVV